MPTHPEIARVVFDESHSEAWTIRPEVARQMQRSHPEDSSYARAADALRARSFAVEAHTSGPLGAATLDGAAVLVMAHPSDPKWERTVPESGPPRLTDGELEAIEAWVRAGGGLILLAEEEQDKYGNNVAELAARFGIGIRNEVVSDYERHHAGAPSWILADLGDGGHGVDLLARVKEVCFYRATTLAEPGGREDRAETDDRAAPDGRATPGDRGAPDDRPPRVLARASATASSPGAPLLAVAQHGAGRVAVLADSDLFGDDCIGELDHEALWLDLVHWVAEPSLAQPIDHRPSEAADDPHWTALKAATDALRLLQEADGSVDPTAHDAAVAGAHVEAMVTGIDGLAPYFPHQRDHLAAVIADLRAWAANGSATPDFTRSLELFRPDLERRDGVEHLVVFPMSLQNASRDRRFE